MADEDDWLARYEERRKRQEEHARRLVDYLVPALRFLGIVSVSIEFDGYGDDGEIQAAVFEPEAVDLPEGIARLIEEACCYALPGGWEINEGSFGTWRIDVAAGTAQLDMEWREEEPDEEEDAEDED